MKIDPYHFPETSPKAWKLQVQHDLKGEEFNKALVSKTRDGLPIQPCYFEGESRLAIPAASGRFPSAVVRIFIDSGEHALQVMQQLTEEALAHGATVFRLSAKSDEANSLQWLQMLSKDVRLELSGSWYGSAFAKACNEQNRSVSYWWDPIGYLSKTGNYGSSNVEEFEFQQKLIREQNEICIDGSHVEGAGGTPSMQLQFICGVLLEYLNANADLGIQIKHVHIRVGVGTNYFEEIAKLQALKVLVSTLCDAFGVNADLKISALVSTRTHTLADYNQNLLRSSTSCMAAICAGVDSIVNPTYDQTFNKVNSFSQRISLNQLLLLQHEAGFDEAHEAPRGSYYLDQLTSELAHHALGQIKKTEAKGGLLNSLHAGAFQHAVREARVEQERWFAAGDLILVGSNMFQDTDATSVTHEVYPFLKRQQAHKTLIEPIVPRRLAEKLEQDA